VKETKKKISREKNILLFLIWEGKRGTHSTDTTQPNPSSQLSGKAKSKRNRNPPRYSGFKIEKTLPPLSNHTRTLILESTGFYPLANIATIFHFKY
jgi:hypothetical protein